METTSEVYRGYIKKVADFRKEKLKEWNLEERSQENYRLFMISSPYDGGLDDLKKLFPGASIPRERTFYFLTQ